MIDSTRINRNNLCLPAGPLREPISRLTLSDIVVYNSKSKDFDIFIRKNIGIIHNFIKCS